MKYYQYNTEEAKAKEISKERAKELLTGWWKDEYLEDIFNNNRSFRLFTPYAEIWTNNNGLVPMAGYYGIVE